MEWLFPSEDGEGDREGLGEDGEGFRQGLGADGEGFRQGLPILQKLTRLGGDTSWFFLFQGWL